MPVKFHLITDNSAGQITFGIWSVVEGIHLFIQQKIQITLRLIHANGSDEQRESGTNTRFRWTPPCPASEFELENLADGPKLITSRFNGKDGVGGSPGNVKTKFDDPKWWL